jgi:hypothetical protein
MFSNAGSEHHVIGIDLNLDFVFRQQGAPQYELVEALVLHSNQAAMLMLPIPRYGSADLPILAFKCSVPDTDHIFQNVQIWHYGCSLQN